MLILIFSIALVLAIVSTILCQKVSSQNNLDFIFFVFALIGYVVVAIVLLVFIFMIPEVATSGRIDEKIAMYEEENAKIEAQMDILVEKYMKYEQETFSDLKTEESAITLVTLFPELKSDELVQTQINVYTSNNTQIKKLKEEKINMQTKRWILFFKK